MKTSVMTTLLSLALVALAGPQDLFCQQDCAPTGFDPQEVIRSVRRNRGLAETTTPAPGRVSEGTVGKKQLTDDGEFLIDTSHLLVGAPHYQEYPAVAFDGANFLVVWEDARSGSYDIYGARVTPGGAVLDPQGIPISAAVFNQRWPAVAFDGANFFVVWTDDRGGIYGARVTPGGAVLDPQGFAISTTVAAVPAIAFDGTNFLVVWEDYRVGREADIYGARVDPRGTVLDPEGIPISTAADNQKSPAIAFDGMDFLVVWTDYRSGSESDIYGTRVSASGTVLDPEGFPISTAENGQYVPDLAFDGANFLVVWLDWRSGSNYDIYGARVTPSGTVLDPQGLPISPAADGQYDPAIAFDGTNFVVVWRDDRSGGYDIYGTRVSPSGTVLDPQGFPISTAADWQLYSALAFNGTNFLVVWQDYRGSSSWDIYGARVTPSGTVLDPQGIPISTAAYSQYDPAVAFDGANFLVVWEDYRNGSTDIYGARVTPGGAVLDPQGFAISTAVYNQRWPAVAFDGANFLVVWQDNRSGGDDDIYGARVSPSGTVLDPQGFPISTATNDQYVPALAFSGANFLVVWTDARSGGYDVYGARVTPGGTVLDPQGIPISTAANYQYVPALAFSGANFLVVWADDRGGGDDDIYGARVTPGGTVLDPQGFPISTAAYDQWSSAVAFDGANFLVVWEDNRSGGGYDIYGARVSPSGTVSGEGPVVMQEGNQFEPTLVRGPGSQLFLVYQGWTGTLGGRTYNAYRIWGKLDPLTAIAELPRTEARTPVTGPTIVRNTLNLPSASCDLQSPIALLDAAGRKVLDLLPGPNDLSRLAPGVYFVCPAAGAKREASRVTRVVLAR